MKTGTPATRAKFRYAEKNYDQVSIRVPKGEKKKFQEFSEAADLSLAEYLRQAAYEKDGTWNMTESVAFHDCIFRIENGHLIVENVVDPGWSVAKIDANIMARLGKIAEAYGPADWERTFSVLELMKKLKEQGDTLSYTSVSTYEDDGHFYFSDDMTTVETSELIDSDLVAFDDGYWWFRDGLGNDPVPVENFIINA